MPGKPDESLLIDAINYGELYQMPPKSKLPAQEIATLTRWVALGAPWPGPGDVKGGPGPSATPSAFNLRERARHWSFQPVRDAAAPEVKRAGWPRNPIDRFLLAAMESRGLAPAPEADKRTLIRRLTFDLTGLPPTPEEVAAFLADHAPRAYEALVERLLASPHYGERWGRHWLDLVRFAETLGHEFDYDLVTPSVTATTSSARSTPTCLMTSSSSSRWPATGSTRPGAIRPKGSTSRSSARGSTASASGPTLPWTCTSMRRCGSTTRSTYSPRRSSA